MESSWLSYIPHLVAADILRNPTRNPLAYTERLTAVALFADVSGFTAISEALGQTGRRGTEELTTLLNGYFEPMIDLIEQYGGIVAKFAGDAMTVLFPYTADSQELTVQQAVYCALEMQKRMVNYASLETSVGQYSLTMKAGLAQGAVLCTNVGTADKRLETVVAGEAIDLCADAEHHATSGEVVVHQALKPYLTNARSQLRDESFYQILSIPTPPSNPLPALANPTAAAYAHIRPFIHPTIAKRIENKQSALINEHRLVTIIFVSFAGLDYDHDPAVPDKLQSYFEQVIDIIHKYGGFLNKIDMGDKGSKYIILFGAPVGHEDDEVRAVNCAAELRGIADYPIRVGINTGFVYSGQVGAAVRQEYTVMGDHVNLAARLMQAAAPGQILIAPNTWQTVKSRFITEALPPMRVKGKTEAIVPYALQHQAQAETLRGVEPTYDLPMVGRAAELSQLKSLLKQVKNGRGQLIGIKAEAGMGKSRLAAELRRLATAEGFTAITGAAQSYGRTTPYLVWRTIWRAFFELQPTNTAEEQISHLHQRITAINALYESRLPLLSPLLNLPIPDNATTAQFEPQLKAELLRSLLLDFWQQWATQGPLLIILEDCHWIDALSQTLLTLLGRNIDLLPIALVVLYRPPEGYDEDPLSWATQEEPLTLIELQDLSPAEGEQLAKLKLEQLWPEHPHTAASLVEQLITKAGGNPFYLEELVNYIHDQGLQPDQLTSVEQLSIPDSLHNLIISRIDQLPEVEKTTLKVASIIGRMFRASWIWGSYPLAGDPPTIRRHLRNLRRLDLTPLHDTYPEPTYLFKHITTQEVAYESMAYATRATIHGNLGQYLEETYAEQLTQYVDMLAHHYGRSDNKEKQVVYFRQAGDVAKETYNNDAAVDYYERLLTLLPAKQQAAVQLELGQVQQLIGEWATAEQLYLQALEASQQYDEFATAAECALALGSLLYLSRPESDEALNWLRQAQNWFTELNDQHGIGQVLAQLSFILSQRGEDAQAIAYAEEQLAIAQAADDQLGLSAAYRNIGNCHFVQGAFNEAKIAFEQSITMAEAAQDRQGTILSANNLAGVYWFQGNYDQSLAQLQKVQNIAQTIGHREIVGVSAGNAGTVYRQVGMVESALACYQTALDVGLALGDWDTIATSLGNLAELYIDQDQYDTAAPLLARSLELFQTLEAPFTASYFLQRQATLLHTLNRTAEAVQVNQQAIEVAEQVQRQDVLLQAQLLAVRIEVAEQQITLEEATAKLRQWLTADPPWPPAEQAQLHQLLWELTGNTEAKEQAAVLYQSLYEEAPNVAYLKQYRQLTGKTLTRSQTVRPWTETTAQARSLAQLLAQAGIEETKTAA